MANIISAKEPDPVPRMGSRIGSGSGEAVGFALDQEDIVQRPTLLGQVYSLTGFQGQGFDEHWIRRIRAEADPGFVPIVRRMVFRAVTGGEIWRESWGVARYSKHRPAPDWELRLLRQAVRPTRGYLATLERPNLIDMWYPPLPMDEDGLPPKFWPFNGQLMLSWFKSIIRERAACRDFDAFELLMRTYEAEQVREQKDFDSDLDQRARDAVDMFPKFSTTNVRPTPRAQQIQETAQ